MTKKIRCRICKGWGTLVDKFVTCHICGGDGIVMEGLNPTKCRACKGKGRLRETCHLCGGSGWYKMKEEKKSISYGRRR